MSCLNLNEVRLAGRVVNDPELKTTQGSGLSVTSFRVAVNRPRKEGQEDQADFVTVIAWRQRAEFVTRYFRKGMAIYVAGQLRSRTWEDGNGNKRSTLEVVADDIRFIDSKNENNNGAGEFAPPTSYAQTSDNFEELGGDDDLPF